MKGKIKGLSIMAVISILAIVFAVIGGITTASMRVRLSDILSRIVYV